MGERFTVGIQGASIFPGQFEVIGRRSVISGEAVVWGDLPCQWPIVTMPVRMADKRFGYAAMQQPSSRQAGLFIHKAAQFLVAEVVGQIVFTRVALYLFDQSLRDQVFQSSNGFIIAAPTRFTQGVEVE